MRRGRTAPARTGTGAPPGRSAPSPDRGPQGQAQLSASPGQQDSGEAIPSFVLFFFFRFFSLDVFEIQHVIYTCGTSQSEH